MHVCGLAYLDTGTQTHTHIRTHTHTHTQVALVKLSEHDVDVFVRVCWPLARRLQTQINSPGEAPEGSEAVAAAVRCAVQCVHGAFDMPVGGGEGGGQRSGRKEEVAPATIVARWLYVLGAWEECIHVLVGGQGGEGGRRGPREAKLLEKARARWTRRLQARS